MKDMNKLFEEPTVEIIEFVKEDVIQTSGLPGEDKKIIWF